MSEPPIPVALRAAPRRVRLPSFAALLVATSLAIVGAGPSAARAQDGARVQVEVTGADGRPSDATVVLTPRGGGAALQCRTRAGRCDLQAVPRGRYVLTATPASEGRPPLPLVIWVPPRVASVDVRVRLR